MANVALLGKVLDHIRANRKEHSQEQWARTTRCGTTYCFAGWTVQLAGHEIDWSDCAITETLDVYDDAVFVTGSCKVPDERPEYGELFGGSAAIWTVARYELGLTENEAAALFMGANTFAAVEETVARIIADEELTEELHAEQARAAELTAALAVELDLAAGLRELVAA
jgi:hypothetical protein